MVYVSLRDTNDYVTIKTQKNSAGSKIAQGRFCIRTTLSDADQPRNHATIMLIGRNKPPVDQGNQLSHVVRESGLPLSTHSVSTYINRLGQACGVPGFTATNDDPRSGGSRLSRGL
jgi:hypothetical protein